MHKLNIAMANFCLALGAAILALFFYSILILRQIAPGMLLYVVGAILTARVFWKRAKAAPGAEQK